MCIGDFVILSTGLYGFVVSVSPLEGDNRCELLPLDPAQQDDEWMFSPLEVMDWYPKGWVL